MMELIERGGMAATSDCCNRHSFCGMC